MTVFDKAWSILKFEGECKNCGKTSHLFMNPMHAGTTGNAPSVCRDCVSDIESSNQFYSYYN